jgi:hypothetical protein
LAGRTAKTRRGTAIPRCRTPLKQEKTLKALADLKKTALPSWTEGRENSGGTVVPTK